MTRMTRHQWLNSFRSRFSKSSSPRKTRRRRGSRRTGQLERLEDRTLLTSFVVDTPLDVVDAGDGLTSLREAVTAANGSAGLDDITFDASLSGMTILQTLGIISITDDLIINGLGADELTIDGTGTSKIFDVFDDSLAGMPIEVEITDLRLTGGNGLGGVSPGAGGAIFNAESLLLRRMNIEGNTADFGGGVCNNVDLVVVDSTIANNFASVEGGGIFSGQHLLVINSTLHNNFAFHNGGGVHVTNGDAEFRNVTVTLNTADSNDALEALPGAGIGGGIYTDPSAMSVLFNTIVADNYRAGFFGVPNDLDGIPVEAISSNNLIGDAASSGGLTDGVMGNIVGDGGVGVLPIGEILGPLGFNGGPTPTRVPVDDSPAIDSGSDAFALDETDVALATDQRGPGFGRVIDGNGDGISDVDIGAVEAPPGSSSTIDLDDIAGRASTGTVVASFSTGTSFSSMVVGVVPLAVDWDDVRPGDFNGDGLDDVAGRSPSDGGWRVLINNGVTGFDPPAIWGIWSTAVTFSDLLVGDFNGDGLDDVAARASSGTWVVGISDGTKFVPAAWSAWSTAVAWLDVQTGDFNNDGLTDIVGRSSTGRWGVAMSTGTTFVSSNFGGWSAAVVWSDVQVGDLNADGFSDIIGRSASGKWVVGLSNGSRFRMSTFGAWSTAVTWSDVLIGDFNGDGLADIVGRASNGRVVVSLSNGSRFTSSSFGIVSTGVGWPQVRVGDFNGDGTTDIAMRASTGTWVVGISDGSSFSFAVWGAWSSAVTWDNVFAGELL